MKLLDAIENIEQLDSEHTLYAAEPWNKDSAVVIAMEPDDGGLPDEAARLGCKYFLEVFIAKDFIEDWRATQAGTPSPEEKCTRLVEYAVNDT